MTLGDAFPSGDTPSSIISAEKSFVLQEWESRSDTFQGFAATEELRRLTANRAVGACSYIGGGARVPSVLL